MVLWAAMARCLITLPRTALRSWAAVFGHSAVRHAFEVRDACLKPCSTDGDRRGRASNGARSRGTASECSGQSQRGDCRKAFHQPPHRQAARGERARETQGHESGRSGSNGAQIETRGLITRASPCVGGLSTGLEWRRWPRDARASQHVRQNPRFGRFRCRPADRSR